jgi:hypothetical protein
MDERFRRVEQVEQRVQMLLGIFASRGVLHLEFKPAFSVGDLLLQHLDALEQEAQEKLVGRGGDRLPQPCPGGLRWKTLQTLCVEKADGPSR